MAIVNPEALFSLAGLTVLPGWLLLLASPLAPVWSDRIAGYLIPIVLSITYAGLILVFWSDAPGGFDSLAAVAELFATPQLLVAGWIHYLAFDLFVGAWMVRKARDEGMAFILVACCLPITFLFGPAGFLLFTAIRAARWSNPAARPA